MMPRGAKAPSPPYFFDTKEPPGPWVERARCRNEDTNRFFPDKRTSNQSIEETRKICAICVVRTSCLEYAIETSQRWGVWGGMSEKQRRQIRSEIHNKKAA